MSLQDQIVQMIFDELGRTDRELAFNIEKLIRADERKIIYRRLIDEIDLGVNRSLSEDQVNDILFNAMPSLESTEEYPNNWPESACEFGDLANEKIYTLLSACIEIREIYAGMDGSIPETAAEAYQQRIIKQMYDAAIEAIKKVERPEK